MTIRSRKLGSAVIALSSAIAIALPGIAQADSSSAHAAKRPHAHHHHHKRHHKSHHVSGIPQHNGGDHDADNNGGPSDGDGNI